MRRGGLQSEPGSPFARLNGPLFRPVHPVSACQHGEVRIGGDQENATLCRRNAAQFPCDVRPARRTEMAVNDTDACRQTTERGDRVWHARRIGEKETRWQMVRQGPIGRPQCAAKPQPRAFTRGSIV